MTEPSSLERARVRLETSHCLSSTSTHKHSLKSTSHYSQHYRFHQVRVLTGSAVMPEIEARICVARSVCLSLPKCSVVGYINGHTFLRELFRQTCLTVALVSRIFYNVSHRKRCYKNAAHQLKEI